MFHVDVLLLDLVIVLAAARLLGALARRLRQPPVIGEIVAGILLGPTLLGPWIGDDLFAADMRPPLQALASAGLVLFMFVVGLELDQKLVRGRGRTAITVALGSTAVPFAAGIVLALGLAGEHAQGRGLPFVLFLGAAMAATAFPVLARILTDRDMHRTSLGGLALAAAAVIDVLAWTILAVVVAIAGAGGASGQWKVLLALPYALVMFLLVRPLLARLAPAFERAGRLTPGLLSIVLIGLFASAWATEWAQIHYIFGAFVFGAVMPREEALVHQILERLEQLAVLLLLPMFFVVAGMNVDLRALETGSLGTLAAILAVAVGGKLLGSYGAARLSRVPTRQAAALATLLNTRGLTEIVILTVGLQKGVLDQELYSLMVVMALVTTAMTGPLLRRVYPDRRIARDIAEAERAALGEHAAHRVLVVLPIVTPPVASNATVAPGAAVDPAATVADARSLVALTAALAASASPSEVVLAHLRPYPHGRLEVGTGLSSELLEMTETLSALEDLAAEVRREDLDVRVVSRFAADVAAELPALIASAEPDLLVLPADAPGRGEILSGTTCRAVTVAAVPWGSTAPAAAQGSDVHGTATAPGPSGRPPGPRGRPWAASAVAVQHGSGDAPAHVALALSLAVDRPLVVIGGRSLAGRLAKLGVDVSAAAEPPQDAVVVAAETTPPPPGAHLVVRAELDADPVDWTTAVPARSR